MRHECRFGRFRTQKLGRIAHDQTDVQGSPGSSGLLYVLQVDLGYSCWVFVLVDRRQPRLHRALSQSTSLPLLFFHPVLLDKIDHKYNRPESISFVICSSELEVILRSNQLAKLS